MNIKKKIDWYSVIRVATSILIALIIAAAIIFAVADDPLTALKRFLLGRFWRLHVLCLQEFISW